ncbi:uncharacterized protein LOC134232720, partial [Saccostrea cucullata]|uniref:uncharacterized protein LOC134232720 n=1 Tax=Saccostrea cuccullata TaxID=36930 RepID=UPI002ED03215
RECFELKKDSSFETGYIKTFSSESTQTTLASTEGCSGFGCPAITLGFAVGIAVAVILLIAAVSVFVIYKKKRRKDVKSSSNQERHPNKETDSKGHKSEGYEEENITLVQHEDTFKDLNQEVNTFHDPLHAGYFSRTGQKHTPYIPSTHDYSFTPEEENPAFLEYTSKSIRLLSFSGFSPQEMVENLASAGFFYAGYDSTTTCFQCGCEKDDWKLGDDAIFEHKGLNSRCPFVRDTENARGKPKFSVNKET